MSSDNVTSRLDSLRSSGSAAFQKTNEGEKTVAKKDRPNYTVKSTRDLESSVKDNPFYKIVSKADLSNEEKVALIRKVLTYNREETKEQNAERILLLGKLEEFFEAQNLGLAGQLIDLNGSDVYPQLKNTIGQIMDQWTAFEKEISAITGPLKTIEEIRSAGGKDEVIEALRKANESKKLGEELNAQVAALNAESDRISNDKTNATETAAQLEKTQEIEKSKKARNFFSKMVGGKSYTAMVQRDQDIADNKAKSEQLAQDLEEKRLALEEQLKNLQELDAILAADPTQRKIQDLIDIGTAEYQKRVDSLKDSAKAFIQFTRENMETCVQRLKLSGQHIEGLDSSNETLTTYYNLIAQGNREAMGENVRFDEALHAELKELEAGNPDDPKVQIRTMEVKSMAAGVNNFVTSQQSASQRHTVARNNLGEQQTAIIALKRHNEVSLQKATINLNNGVSTAATHFATVLIAVNSAATAEASEQIGEMFGKVRDMTQDTLESVLGHIIDDISEGRVEIAKQSEGIRKLAGTLSNINDGLLSGVKDMLTSLDEADESNKELAAIARKNRAVETEANREHVTGESTVEAGPRTAKTDRFGLDFK